MIEDGSAGGYRNKCSIFSKVAYNMFEPHRLFFFLRWLQQIVHFVFYSSHFSATVPVSRRQASAFAALGLNRSPRRCLPPPFQVQKSPGWLAYWEICHESERIKVLNCLLIKVLIVLKTIVRQHIVYRSMSPVPFVDYQYLPSTETNASGGCNWIDVL